MGEIMNQFTENLKVTNNMAGSFFIDPWEEFVEWGLGSVQDLLGKGHTQLLD